uniref:Uncharacterized protein n=1 Tax=Chrysotila carterae TaxID=13221 RepID=A0A7S4BFS4_CHRCT|mmetsp:Transcript_22560/g.43841  ORF Transcript_22560/g.43841 Transcript_22560/m.43841 type:complete len:378 (-) Transcript_22560:191-1324(-)
MDSQPATLSTYEEARTEYSSDISPPSSRPLPALRNSQPVLSNQTSFNGSSSAQPANTSKAGVVRAIAHDVDGASIAIGIMVFFAFAMLCCASSYIMWRCLPYLRDWRRTCRPVATRKLITTCHVQSFQHQPNSRHHVFSPSGLPNVQMRWSGAADTALESGASGGGARRSGGGGGVCGGGVCGVCSAHTRRSACPPAFASSQSGRSAPLAVRTAARPPRSTAAAHGVCRVQPEGCVDGRADERRCVDESREGTMLRPTPPRSKQLQALLSQHKNALDHLQRERDASVPVAKDAMGGRAGDGNSGNNSGGCSVGISGGNIRGNSGGNSGGRGGGTSGVNICGSSSGDGGGNSGGIGGGNSSGNRGGTSGGSSPRSAAL